MLDQAERLRALASKGKSEKESKIITVTSGKGGVGKSNFVVNLGLTLRKQGYKVLIFDADVGMGNDDVLLGIYPKHSVMDILNGMEFSDVLVEGPGGIMLLPGGSGLNVIEDLDEKKRSIFLEKLEGLEGFDYILMDTGAGVNRSVLAFIAASFDLIVITTPEPTSLTDAYSLLKAVNHFKIKDNAKIVVNKALDADEGRRTFNRFKRAVDKFLEINVEYLGCIFEDRCLTKSVREQKPVALSYPDSPSARSIESIAIGIVGDMRAPEEKGSIKGLFKKLFKILK